MNWQTYKFRAHALPKLMVNGRKKSDPLSETTKAYLREVYIAEVYGVRQELMHCIMAHEGGYKPGTNEYNWEATNPNSSATGAAQFIAGTWVSIRTKMGEDPSLELRTDPHETVKTLAWALGNGYKHHWQVVTPLNLCN